MSTPPQPRQYGKVWMPLDSLLDLLIARGLIVSDRNSAIHFLCHTNYYRLSGYCLAFETQRHHFRHGVTFEQIMQAYNFDRDLRDLLTEALEVVEIDFRAAVAIHFAKTHGPFGYASAGLFHGSFGHPDWLQRLRRETDRSSELFVQHFRNDYRLPDLPIWAATEIMSFGALSEMFRGMLKADQKAIACRYGIQPGDLATWMHHFTYVRNLCAHHCRVWDRVWSIRPALPKAAAWHPPYLPDNTRLSVTLLALNFIMRHCPALAPFSRDWRLRAERLLANPPAISNAASLMGWPSTGFVHPLWS